jgi:protein-tyrosine phosphatase
MSQSFDKSHYDSLNTNFASSPSWIIPEKVAIGKFLDTDNHDFVRQFKSILALDGRVSSAVKVLINQNQIGIFDIIDGKGNRPNELSEAVQFVKDNIEKNAPLLIYCNAGRSRSPLILAAYLADRSDGILDNAINMIAQKRIINISPELLESVRKALKLN